MKLDYTKFPVYFEACGRCGQAASSHGSTRACEEFQMDPDNHRLALAEFNRRQAIFALGGTP